MNLLCQFVEDLILFKSFIFLVFELLGFSDFQFLRFRVFRFAVLQICSFSDFGFSSFWVFAFTVAKIHMKRYSPPESSTWFAI